MRYSDPSGNFSLDQLHKWFKKEWDTFSKGWQAVLLKAEFGDAVVIGDTTAVFAQSDGALVGWDVNVHAALTIGQLTSVSGDLALYRSQNANQSGGPTQNSGAVLFGELTDPVANDMFGSNNYLRIMGDPENTSASIILPEDWYMGEDTHVEVASYFAGFQLGISDIVSVGGSGYLLYNAAMKAKQLGGFSARTAAKALGGWVGLITLAVDVATWTTWDTSYTITRGQGQMPRSPVPTPRSK
jgi:hypothetical protein